MRFRRGGGKGGGVLGCTETNKGVSLNTCRYVLVLRYLLITIVLLCLSLYVYKYVTNSVQMKAHTHMQTDTRICLNPHPFNILPWILDIQLLKCIHYIYFFPIHI